MVILAAGIGIALLSLGGTAVLVCVIVAELGQAFARRHRQQCPDCDYRPPRATREADMLIHRVLEHYE